MVEVNGKLHSGIGKIIESFYPTEQPKGELIYLYKYGEPFPQLGVEFEDGEKFHYNADDLLEGKIKKSDKEFNHPKKLVDWMNELIIDCSEADFMLWEIDENSIKSLYRTIFEFSDISKFIEPLLEEEVYSNTYEEVYLNEFDSHVFEFKSTVSEDTMRNNNIPAFLLTITIDGYAPPTMKLNISEVYTCSM